MPLPSSVEDALAETKNEPLKWLFGESLRQYSEVPAGHFLLKLLAAPRTGTLASWNAWIYRFRELLVNPDQAPTKACADLRGNGSDSDIDIKLRGVVAEIQAVITLSAVGFSDFQIVMAGGQASPDFIAVFDGQRARIEVKNLREPKDFIRMIASDQWTKRSREHPDRYRFDVALRHANRGPLTTVAERRLRSIIDQLPQTTQQWGEVLDGEVEVSFERIAGNSANTPEYGGLLQSGSPGRLVVVSPIMAQHFDYEPSELQALFLKAIRIVVEAQAKFFGKETSEPGSLNVFALRWETPEPFYDPRFIEEVQSRIEQLYASFDLPLRIIIFAGHGGPDVPVELLRRFR